MPADGVRDKVSYLHGRVVSALRHEIAIDGVVLTVALEAELAEVFLHHRISPPVVLEIPAIERNGEYRATSTMRRFSDSSTMRISGRLLGKTVAVVPAAPTRMNGCASKNVATTWS